MLSSEKRNEFVVTARKWRPQRFSDVVGQQHISTTLKNAISSNRIHHAYLFCGPRGVGKTTTARILARAINCENPKEFEPCNNCETCIAVLEGKSLDIIEIDGASNNSVDDVRKLRENSKYPPSLGKYKMYIIDEVHMLSTSAFNALLKTLEEPPPHLLFVFATTESHKLPATIISRCQRFDFRRMEINEISSQLRMIAATENITIDEESLVTIAKKADGSMRDGQSIFDRIVAFCGMNIIYAEMAEALHLIDTEFFFRISDAIRSNNISEMFHIADEVIRKGYDLQECMQGLLEHFRNILTIKATSDIKMIDSSASTIERYKSEVDFYSKADLLRILNIISSTEQTLKYSAQPRIKFEMGLLQLASLDSLVEIGELLNEIKLLKSNPEILNARVIQTIKSSEPIKKNVINSDPSLVYNTKPAPVLEKSSEVQNKISEPSLPASAELVKDSATVIDKVNRQPIKENLEDSWIDFIRKIAGSKSGSMLLDQAKVIFNDAEIILNIDNNFVYENIFQKRGILQSELKDFYGKHISVKLIKIEDLGSHDSSSSGIETDVEIYNSQNKNFIDNSSINSTIAENNSNKISDKHPIERSIIDLFDAKQLF
ncbi:MAG: DNA polymerase III subunit gamma/tau [Candidatus Kapabacteria bacterium]|nr:DNA polymerase III subunit gamma/tau [Candidatus Kapabacteria bacterium]